MAWKEEPAAVVVLAGDDDGALVEALTQRMHVATIRVALDGDDEIDQLAARLATATDTVRMKPELAHLPLVLVASGRAGAAALVLASARTDLNGVVACDTRLDLAGDALEHVRVPVLLVVDENDDELFAANRSARSRLKNSEIAPTPRAERARVVQRFVAAVFAADVTS